MARVWLSRLQPLGAWVNSIESSGSACGSPRSPIKLIIAPFLNNLKILNLSNSKFAKTPNFLDVFRLERLILEDCRNLAEVHQSVGHLKELVHLSLKGCCSLTNLPGSICNLKSLETLDISMCSRLENLPEHLGVMESLTELIADETAIRQLPSSVGQLKRLGNSLSLLRGLDLSYRGLSEGEISIDLGSLSSLQELNLSGNKFFNLPSGIGLLPKLNYLLVKDCTNLLSVPELPSSLMELDAVNCSALERLTIHSKRIPSLYVSGCNNLIEIEGMEGMGKRWVIVSEDRSNLSNNLKQSLVQALCKGEEYDIVIADGEMPELFSNRAEGSSLTLTFHVPPGSDGNKIQGLVAWVVCAIDGNISAYLRGEAVIRNKSNGVQLFKRSIMLFTMSTNSSNQCSWVNHISLAALPPNAMKAGEQLELSVEVKHTSFEVQKCGVHMIVKKPEVE
ncbi:disease resistance protein RPV1-like [Populus alba x Populus x berolinensis]|uniref:Disease resistance protein RPV1-like n=1 Tax=Populus alba x Populus x berolinensis TaxID=444605 RepID=A0AAD6Q0F5_9ROSI|nr:disease resistance protein RPV1-like [Populus alba x Populus x berolinensis]